MVYEFLKIIRNFPQVSFEGTTRLIEFIKVSLIKHYNYLLVLQFYCLLTHSWEWSFLSEKVGKYYS